MVVTARWTKQEQLVLGIILRFHIDVGLRKNVPFLPPDINAVATHDGINLRTNMASVVCLLAVERNVLYVH